MEKDKIHSLRRLATNNDYYSNIFKKTERLITTVFYILSHIPKTESTEFFLKTATLAGEKTLNEAVSSLSFYEYEMTEKLFPFQQELVALEGKLRIGNAQGILTDETLSLLVDDIDLIQRFLRNHFIKTTSPLAVSNDEEDREETSSVSKKDKVIKPKAVKSTTTPRKQRIVIPEGDISSDAHLVYSQLVDRTVRIKTVLEAKPESTIKDISEVITDVGEKTIQRDLNMMIEQGQVIRQGERRWSKYSLSE